MLVTFTIWATLIDFLVGSQGSTFSAVLSRRRVGGLCLRGISCSLTTRFGSSGEGSGPLIFTILIVRVVGLTFLSTKLFLNIFLRAHFLTVLIVRVVRFTFMGA
ncbi:hypothetical protein L3X38_017452 [Prunus dulcis]|uniref:Secreted peptide n=1 Tax=Prunus dulcis TaxID=3755 RepID=A0AAD4ZA27_PRUDU|nr:hypothetical protein L3X38_017452 [Prunus dulcis]